MLTTRDFSTEFSLLLTLVLSLVAVVGVFGNGLVILVIAQSKRLRSALNTFLLNLAIADLVVSFLCIPLTMIINFSPELVSSAALCKAARFFQYLAPESSMILLIVIAYCKHRTFVHPFSSLDKVSYHLIACAWVYSVSCVSPSLYFSHLESYTDEANATVKFCSTIQGTTTPSFIYILLLGSFGFVLPIIALCILNIRIYRIFRQKSRVGHETSNPALIRYDSVKRKVLKLFIIVITVFLVSWTPFVVYTVAMATRVSSAKQTQLSLYAFGLSHSVCNPMIYCFYNNNFRKGCRDVFHTSRRLLSAKKRAREANLAARRDKDDRSKVTALGMD